MGRRPRELRLRIRKQPNKRSQSDAQRVIDQIDALAAERRARGLDTPPPDPATMKP